MFLRTGEKEFVRDPQAQLISTKVVTMKKAEIRHRESDTDCDSDCGTYHDRKECSLLQPNTYLSRTLNDLDCIVGFERPLHIFTEESESTLCTSVRCESAMFLRGNRSKKKSKNKMMKKKTFKIRRKCKYKSTLAGSTYFIPNTSDFSSDSQDKIKEKVEVNIRSKNLSGSYHSRCCYRTGGRFSSHSHRSKPSNQSEDDIVVSSYMAVLMSTSTSSFSTDFTRTTSASSSSSTSSGANLQNEIYNHDEIDNDTIDSSCINSYNTNNKDSQSTHKLFFDGVDNTNNNNNNNNNNVKYHKNNKNQSESTKSLSRWEKLLFPETGYIVASYDHRGDSDDDNSFVEEVQRVIQEHYYQRKVNNKLSFDPMGNHFSKGKRSCSGLVDLDLAMEEAMQPKLSEDKTPPLTQLPSLMIQSNGKDIIPQVTYPHQTDIFTRISTAWTSVRLEQTGYSKGGPETVNVIEKNSNNENRNNNDLEKKDDYHSTKRQHFTSSSVSRSQQPLQLKQKDDLTDSSHRLRHRIGTLVSNYHKEKIKALIGRNNKDYESSSKDNASHHRRKRHSMLRLRTSLDLDSDDKSQPVRSHSIVGMFRRKEETISSSLMISTTATSSTTSTTTTTTTSSTTSALVGWLDTPKVVVTRCYSIVRRKIGIVLTSSNDSNNSPMNRSTITQYLKKSHKTENKKSGCK